MDSVKGLSDSFSYAFLTFCYHSDITKFETWNSKKKYYNYFYLSMFLIKIVVHQWLWTSSISDMNQRDTMWDFYKGLQTFTTFQRLQYIVCLATPLIIAAKLCKIVPLTQYLQSLHLQKNRISRGKKKHITASPVVSFEMLKHKCCSLQRCSFGEALRWLCWTLTSSLPCLSHPLWANAKWEEWTGY